MKTKANPILKVKTKLTTEQNQPVPVVVAKGDGIGPEIMDATLRILEAAGANIAPSYIDLGEQVYLSGNTSGIDNGAWEAIKNSKVILKAPITTPQGKGYKSLNVTLRKSLGLYANVRPVAAYAPYVHTNFPNMDVVVIRENEEDLYAGIEHRQTPEVYQCLKLITRPGCEKIIYYAFEYAKAFGRKKVTCMVKDNIMKITDGLFHEVFEEIAKQYPDIESDTQIIDIGSAKLAAKPENYDVVVTTNLYGDIVSDIVAEIAGSVGMCGSANIGKEVAMFEAIHGSAPDIAGKGIANPSGLIHAAVAMLAHVGQSKIADKIKNAWLVTLEKGYHTADIFHPKTSKAKLSTQQFADQVIAHLDQQPVKLEASKLNAGNGKITIPEYQRKATIKTLVGVDVFIDWQGKNPEEIGWALQNLDAYKMKLKMITNRGVKVFPNGLSETFCTDHWRCRFVADAANDQSTNASIAVDYEQVIALLSKIYQSNWDVIKTENLYEFDGKKGYSLGQGE